MYKLNTKFEILTPTGFKHFSGLQKNVKDSFLRIKFTDNTEITCSKDHTFIDPKLVIASSLLVGDKLGEKVIKSIEFITKNKDLYDPVNVDGGHLFIANDIISHNCSFLGTGDTYIEGEILSQLYEAVDDEYWCSYSQRMRLWKEPDPSHDYIISVDPSLGRERDSTVFLVFNVYNGELVAEFKSPNTPLNQCCKILVDVAHKYNNAMIIPERNSIGTNLIENLIDLGYDYIWADDKGTLGFQTNTTSRDVALAVMEEFVRTRKVKLPSRRIIEELLTFIINDQGKFEADEGCHDDMVMALAIACVGLKDLVSGSPIESRLGETLESQQDTFSKNYTISLGSNGQQIEEEDYRWLLQN